MACGVSFGEAETVGQQTVAFLRGFAAFAIDAAPRALQLADALEAQQRSVAAVPSGVNDPKPAQ